MLVGHDSKLEQNEIPDAGAVIAVSGANIRA
jgi:hypothetical protein